MNFDMGNLVGLIFVAGFFAVAFLWVMFVTRRLRPYVCQKLGERWGVKISERIRFRSVSWEIQGKHTRQQGCMVSIVQFVTGFGCLVVPIFGALALMIVLLMALSEA